MRERESEGGRERESKVLRRGHCAKQVRRKGGGGRWRVPKKKKNSWKGK
jgi:hypothetical protein